jgi:coenzyme F420-0:L-glutamate ligase/coenzyme F420-1:gamma-L-glutamate ligase
LQGAPEAGVDLGAEVVRVSAPTAYELGVAVTRLEVALWGEGLEVKAPMEAAGLEVTLRVTER